MQMTSISTVLCEQRKSKWLKQDGNHISHLHHLELVRPMRLDYQQQFRGQCPNHNSSYVGELNGMNGSSFI